jgi:molybdate transport system regulatory protein
MAVVGVDGDATTKADPGMARLTIRIDLDRKAAFGPGKARLLEELDEIGSIRGAAAAMDMSYRRAWLLVQDIEATTGAPVIVAKTGGVGGGGVALTDLGHNLLSQYRAIERKAASSVGTELRTLVKLCGGGSGKAARSRAASRLRKRRRLPRRC